MEQETDLSSEELDVLGDFRALLEEVVRLDHEYYGSANLHPDDTGSEREAALLELLQSRFREYPIIQRATVQNLGGTSYKQHDIVFADPEVPPHRVLRSGRALITPRSVHAAVEVKSTLGSKNLVASLDHLAQLKRAARCDVDGTFKVTIGDREFPYVPISGGIFAYRSDLRLSLVAERIHDWAKRNPHELWPNFVTILNRGHLGWIDPSSGEVRTTPHRNDVPMWYEPTDPCGPLIGLVHTLEGLSRWWRAPGTPWRPLPKPLPPTNVGMKIGRPVRPVGMPDREDCDCLCVNCHYYGRMSFDQQRQA